MSQLKNDVVVLASCNIDLISYVQRMPQIGETFKGKSFKMGFGGKGANKAIASSRLGSKCAVISKLGNDMFGQNYLENFKTNQINTDHVFVTDQASTGVAPIFVDEKGNNSIVIILGANLLLSVEDVNKCENAIKNSKVLVTNLELPQESVMRALEIAKSHNVVTILNFAPANETTDQSLFSNTDFLILNEVEAEQLSGLEVKSTQNAQEVALNLIEKLNVQKGVLITLGENGVIWTDKHTKRCYHKKCDKVQVVDSTGAGDAFVGAFAHYLSHLNENQIEKAIDLASEYATLSVQQLGTQSSYPHIDRIDSKFRIN